MVYDPNGGGSGDRWNFFQGLDEMSPGSGNQGPDSAGGYWGGSDPGPKTGDWDQDSGSASGLGQGQARTPRISAAGFDIDTGKYHGPSPWDPIGHDPDTGAPIWPGQEKDRSGPGTVTLPGGLQDADPAAKVLWAVQTNQVPHLKGVPAMDEYGGIHPEYMRAIGSDKMDYGDAFDKQNDQVLALYYPKDVIDNIRSATEQSGYNTSKLSDEEIDKCVKDMPDDAKIKIKEIYNRLPDEGKELNEQEKQDMLTTSRELRDAVTQQINSSECKQKLEEKD